MRYPNALVKVVLLLAIVFVHWVALLPESQGSDGWTMRYNGPGNGDDFPRALAVDAQGNVYVTGYSYGVGSGYDYATIKYSPSGELLWAKRYSGPGHGGDVANALAVDAQGNVYVTGYSTGLSSWEDYATIKYSPNGERLWVRRYNGPGNGWDDARALAVDAQGNVYVTGSSMRVGYVEDYATIKYSPNGDPLWVRRYNGPGNGTDYAWALALDAEGSVYVTGHSSRVGSYYDCATIKYSPNGERLWVRRYNGPGNGPDYANALALDAEGNIYVTGESLGIGSYQDYLTFKYSPNGELLWAKRYNGPRKSSDSANALALDAQGNVYVTGYSMGDGSNYDYATIKYSPNGERLWVRRYNGPGNGWDDARAIALDAQGNVYVTGNAVGVGSGNDYVTIKYSQYE